MKDLKRTMQACTENWRTWLQAVKKDYTMLSAAVMLLALGVLAFSRSTLLPLWLIRQETDDWTLIKALVVVDVFSFAATIIGLLVCGYTAWRGHKAMRRIVSSYHQSDLTRRHRAAIFFVTVCLAAGTLMILWMPVLIIFVSSMAATRTALFGTEVVTPLWAWTGYSVCAFVATWLSCVLMTFVRLCYRDIPKKVEGHDMAEGAEDAASVQ